MFVKIFKLFVVLGTLFTFQMAFGETQQCFFKHDFINTIDGSEHLPEQVCFSQISTRTDEANGRILKIEGNPIEGEFPLEKIMENDEITKHMTYIFAADHIKDEKLWGKVTLRVSVDILRDSNTIDYTYLAAEFFVLRPDGAFDVHMYYYKRNRPSNFHLK